MCLTEVQQDQNVVVVHSPLTMFQCITFAHHFTVAKKQSNEIKLKDD